MLWLTLINHCQIWCAQGSHSQTQPHTAVLLVGSQGMCGSWEELSHLSFPLPKHLTTFIGPQWCGVLVSRVGFSTRVGLGSNDEQVRGRNGCSESEGLSVTWLYQNVSS